MAGKKNAGKAAGADSNLSLSGFQDVAGAKPLAGTWATAAQIVASLPFLAGLVDETFLRNRAREINPRTSAPWLPKPRNNRFEFQSTIVALLEWFAAKAAKAGDLPAYDSAQAMANVFGAEKKTIIWLTRNGADGAQIGGSRIAPLPVLRRALEIAGQVADGRVTGIDGGDEINTNIEIGKKVREERFKSERENALAERRIHDLQEVEAKVRTEILSPVYNDLTGLEKKAHRLKFTPAICVEIVTKDFPRVRAKIAEATTTAGQRDVASKKPVPTAAQPGVTR